MTTVVQNFMRLYKGEFIVNKKIKEIDIDLSDIRYLYGFYNLLIKKFELPEFTCPDPDGLSDFLREPWEENWNVIFIGVSKTNNDIRNELETIFKMFERVKEFQKMAGNEFTWSVED